MSDEYRLVDHFVDDELAFYTIRDDELGLDERNRDDDEHYHVFVGRVSIDGVEHFRFRTSMYGAPVEHLDVPAWRITSFRPEGARLDCTAWMHQVDPRGHRGDLTHIDPDEDAPLGICPIHEK